MAVARAGGSVFELAQYGLPAVLVPYPHATGDHQTANARWMADGGAASVIPDAELTPERLRAEVDAILLDAAGSRAMAAASARLARPDAARDVARAVLGRCADGSPRAAPRVSVDVDAGYAARSSARSTTTASASVL